MSVALLPDNAHGAAPPMEIMRNTRVNGSWIYILMKSENVLKYPWTWVRKLVIWKKHQLQTIAFRRNEKEWNVGGCAY